MLHKHIFVLKKKLGKHIFFSRVVYCHSFIIFMHISLSYYILLMLVVMF